MSAIRLSLTLIFLLVSSTAHAAAVSKIQSVAGSNNFGGASMTASFGSNVTANSTIIVLIMWYTPTARTVTSVTDTLGNDYQFLAPSTNLIGSDQIGSQIVYATNSKAGADTITINWSGGVNGNFAALIETSPSVIDRVSTAANTSTNDSAGAVTTTLNGSFGAACTIVQDSIGASGVYTAGGSWTLFQNTGGGAWAEGVEYQEQSTAGTITGNFTRAGSSPWAAAMAVFRPREPHTFKGKIVVNGKIVIK
jgi:hypothetical protein